MLNPSTRDYSFHPIPHNTYPQIDMFMIRHSLLPQISNASIGTISLSDHAPIGLDLRWGPQRPKPWSWPLNESLIKDKVYGAQLEQEMEEFFIRNNTEGVRAARIWEAHKCFIRGLLIDRGTRVKKERKQFRNDLLEKIHTLESKHKQTLAKEVEVELLNLSEKTDL